MILLTAVSVWAADPEVNLVPWPQSLSLGGGEMALSASSRVVYSDASLAGLAQIVAQEVEEVTRLTVSTASGSPSAGDIYLKLTTDPTITGEAYKVTVGTYATAEAENYNAVAMGSVTILQAIKDTAGAYSIPKMTVTDAPDAAYRGLLVDVARQLHSIDTLKEVVDMCRLYKVRFLQLHLCDDQAFTFPSTAYPDLPNYGRHYSMTEMQDLVAYADARGVIIIPELEVPAHASAMCKAMPDLFASPTSGIINFADPAVWNAVKTLIDEMCDVFQSTPYFHLGADEASIWGLSSDPEFQAAFTTYGVDGIEGLFNYFINELNDKIISRGKKTIVWEGFNYGKSGNSKMDTDISVMMFDNYKHPLDYINAGHPVINASWFPLYIVGSSGFGVPPNYIYDWDKYKFGNYTDPFPRRYDSVYWKNVTPPNPNIPGAQMCSWEMPEENEIPFIRFRIAPYADRIWNPANANGFEHFDTRYDSTDLVLDCLLADHQPPQVPANVGASDGLYENKVRIGWANGGNYPIRFALYKSTTNNSAAATLVTDNLSKSATSYEDTDVVSGQTYYYWLKAWNKWGWSDFSSVATGKTGGSSDLTLAYEPFDYSGGVGIDGQNGGDGFADAWSLVDTGGTATIDSVGLTYPGLVTDGGALRLTGIDDTPSHHLVRSYAGHTGHDMSVVWFSFLIKPEKVADGHAYIGLNNTYDRIGIGKKWGNGFGFHYKQAIKLENNHTYFAIACYDCRPGNDVAYMWIDPDLGQEPGLDTADIVYEGGGLGFGKGLSFSVQGYGQGVYMYDGIRIGSTWAEATTHTGGLEEPPTVASGPTPGSGVIGVSSSSPTLKWTAGRRAASHDVYFGTGPVLDAGDFKGNQTSETYSPGALEFNTTYYWRVDEVNTYGITEGPTWVFTTGGAAALMHHWTFDDAPGSSTAVDSVGGVTLNLNGATLDANGQIGRALSTNAAQVVSATALGTSPTKGFSIAFWAKASDLPSTSRFNPVVGFYENGYGLEVEVDMLRGTQGGQTVGGTVNYLDVDRNGELGSKVYSGSMTQDGLFDVPDDDFIHIVAVCDGVRRDPAHPKRIWINGVEQTNLIVTSTNHEIQMPAWEADHVLHLGYNTPWEPLTHNVGIDDLRLYDGVLNQYEIDALYLSGIDTDGDGVSDFQDNCVDTPNADQSDMDGDGFGDTCDVLPDLTNSDGVNLADLALFAAEWARADCTAPDNCNAADFDKSGEVDIDDLIKMVQFWLD